MDKLRILIVEDEPSFALEVEMLVNELGHSIAGVTGDGEEALALAKIKEPDLILMDINLEGDLNGVDIAEKLNYLEIPVLFMTSEVSPDIYERAKNTCIAGYLVKPFDLLSLKSSIELSGDKIIPRKKQPANGKVIKDSLLVRKATSLVKVPVKEITHAQSHGNHSMLHTKSGEKHLVTISLTKLLHKLPEGDFMKVHKQYIIQLACIEELSAGAHEVRIGKKMIPVGRTFRHQLLNRFETL